MLDVAVADTAQQGQSVWEICKWMGIQMQSIQSLSKPVKRESWISSKEAYQEAYQ